MSSNVRKALMVSLLSILFMSGCASNRTMAEKEATAHPDDPFEGFNRAMWTVNYDYLDPYVARPVSVAYVDYVPSPVRYGISNFLSNLEEPFSMVNSLVMLEGEQASNHFGRFFMNTVFGLGGLIDVASRAEFPTKETESSVMLWGTMVSETDRTLCSRFMAQRHCVRVPVA